MKTFREMDISDLGDNCDTSDLDRFRRACNARQNRTDETDEQVTAAIWVDGDWESAANSELEPRYSVDGMLFSRRWEHGLGYFSSADEAIQAALDAAAWLTPAERQRIHVRIREVDADGCTTDKPGIKVQIS